MTKVKFTALIALCVGLASLVASEALAKGHGGGGGGNRSGGGGIRFGIGGGGGSIRIGGGGGKGGVSFKLGGGGSHSHSKPHPSKHWCPPIYIHPCPPSVVVVPGGPPPAPVVAENAVIPLGSVIEIPGYWGKYDGQVIIEFAGAQHVAKVVRWTEAGVVVDMPSLKLLVPSPAKLLVVRWDKYVFPPMDITLVPAGTGGSGGAASGVAASGPTNGTVSGAPAPGASAKTVSASGTAATGGSTPAAAKATGEAATQTAATAATVAAKPAENKEAKAENKDAGQDTTTEPPGTFDEAVPDEIK